MAGNEQSPKSFEDAAALLYALPPTEFVAERYAVAKAARAAGNRELAAQVTALRRPTTAAWAVNAVVRSVRDEVEELVALGDRLRGVAAAGDGPAMRALSQQRKALIQRLVDIADTASRSAGAPLSAAARAEVDSTLTAAAAEPGAAASVLSGRLETPLHYAGLGFAPAPAPPRVDEAQEAQGGKAQEARGGKAESSPPQPPLRPASPRSATEGTTAPQRGPAAQRRRLGANERRGRVPRPATGASTRQRRRAAEQAVLDAAGRADDLQREYEQVAAMQAQAQAQVDAAARVVEDLLEQLDSARRELAESKERLRAAARSAQEARRAAGTAHRAADQARVALANLRDQ